MDCIVCGKVIVGEKATKGIYAHKECMKFKSKLTRHEKRLLIKKMNEPKPDKQILRANSQSGTVSPKA